MGNILIPMSKANLFINELLHYSRKAETTVVVVRLAAFLGFYFFHSISNLYFWHTFYTPHFLIYLFLGRGGTLLGY